MSGNNRNGKNKWKIELGSLVLWGEIKRRKNKQTNKTNKT